MMHLLQKATYLKFSALPVPIVASIECNRKGACVYY